MGRGLVGCAAMEVAEAARPLTNVAPCQLRSFPVPFNSHGSGGVDGQGSVEWAQSMGQLTLTHRLEGALPERKTWSNEEVQVKMSSNSLEVTLNGTIFKPLTGDLAGDIFRFKSWWVVEDETLIIRLFKRTLNSWKHAFAGPNSGMFRRNAFPWTKVMEKRGTNHNGAGHGMGYAEAAPKEENLEEVSPGRPAVEPGELRPDGTVEELSAGGVFALQSERHICAAHDLCLGLTAQQDDFTVTIEVHFELQRFEELRARYPLEALMATDVWPNAVCIFFQGDRMNPIVWAELDGKVEAMSSTFRISSSDPMRRRQAKGDMYSPCLSVRLTKIREPGSWTRIFKEVWQHKLMVKELGPFGPQRFDGLNGARNFLRAGYNLDDPDFWGNVDHYAAMTMKQSGYTSAPKKLTVT